jgi:hypothetical protein
MELAGLLRAHVTHAEGLAPLEIESVCAEAFRRPIPYLFYLL